MKEQLTVKDTIRVQKAKYCRLVDTKRWGDLAELIVDEPVLRFFDPGGALLYEFNSAADWLRLAKTTLEGAQTIHQVHNDEIEVISDSEVRAIWSMEDYLIFPEGTGGPPSQHGYGHYYETWLLVDGNWRLVELELRRTILRNQVPGTEIRSG